MKTDRRIRMLQHKLNSARLASILWAVIRTTLIIGLSFLILYPIFMKLTFSIRSIPDFYDATVKYVPRNPTFNNFLGAWEGLKYPTTLFSTIGFTSLIAFLQMASCAFVAYGLARFNIFGGKIIFSLVILTFVIPPQAILLPLYFKFNYFNIFNFFQFTGSMSGVSLINTPAPFIMMSATAVAFRSGIYIYLLRQFYVNMPTALEEAAQIDGCGNMKTFFKIMLPGSVPMLATVFLFSFVMQWNDYNYSIFLAPNLPVLSMQINNLVNNLNSNGGQNIAQIIQNPAFLLLVAPLVILYVFTQRLFVESIEKSGIVG
jgi:multiple sugar transport system permease protein